MSSLPVRFVARSAGMRSLLVALVLAFVSLPASAQPSDGSSKLDPVLQARARQLWGRSRVIVEFKGTTDLRVITSA